MFLYRTHPTSLTTNSVVNLNEKEKLKERLCEGINHRDTEEDDIISLVTDASVVDAMVSTGEYGNILVLPTPIVQERLRDTMYQPIGNAGDMLFPIIHRVTGGRGNVFIGLPEGQDHLYKNVWEEYNIPILPMDNWFNLDRNIDIKTPPYMKFDAVVLLGCKHSLKTGTFKSEDIRKRLSSVINDRSVLIDVNRKGSERKITGKMEDISDKKNYLTYSINSQMRILDYSIPSGLSPTLCHTLFEINTQNGNIEPHRQKEMLHHKNLCYRNMTNLENFYKVYK